MTLPLWRCTSCQQLCFFPPHLCHSLRSIVYCTLEDSVARTRRNHHSSWFWCFSSTDSNLFANESKLDEWRSRQLLRGVFRWASQAHAYHSVCDAHMRPPSCCQPCRRSGTISFSWVCRIWWCFYQRKTLYGSPLLGGCRKCTVELW